jgi:hypothetical protein
MANQSVRQAARRSALDAQARMRSERAEQERRRSGLAVAVVTALAERDALVLACEKRAGEALVKMTSAGGLTLREAVRWCGEQITLREATRLRQVAGEVGDTETTKGDEKSVPATLPVAVAQVSTAR